MAKNKPTKPTNLMPRSFGGEKNNFSDDLIANGYEVNTPQTYNGDNLNYQLNATGKEFEYVESVVDYIVAMPSNNILTVNSNNQLDYLNANTLAVDNNVVHKTGDETIAGTKTFNNTIVGSVNGNANTATNDIDGNPIKTTYQKVSNLSQVINESETNYPSNKAVKTAIDAKDSLPSQTGNAGKFLTTDGTNASWENSYTPPLLSCMWSDHLLSDMSWLRADTFSWQSGDVYVTAYNHLVSDYSEAVPVETDTINGITIYYKRSADGHKVCHHNQEQNVLDIYNSTGVAWYYILDTTNTRFKLPRTKYDFVGLRDSVGGYVAESLPNITGSAYLASGGNGTVTNGALTRRQVSATNINTQGGTNHSWSDLILDASGSSNAYQDNAPVQQRATQMYLYFYVGNYTQSAIQQTAGINAELFNGKMDINHANDTKPYITDTYKNGTSWYRVWSDGWCEQGGVVTNTSGRQTVTLLKPYSDGNYNVQQTILNATAEGKLQPFTESIQSRTGTSFTIYCDSSMVSKMWKACGYMN